VEGCVVAGGAEVFCVDCSWALALLAFFYFRFPVEGFVTGVTEAFGVMFFFFRAIATYFDYHLEKRRSHIK
jgi:hypothetical protein